MPLNAAALKSGIEAVARSPGATPADCAAAWAAAIVSYFSAVVPASTTVAATQATLTTALAGAFTQPTPGMVFNQMESALLAAALTIGGGMTGVGFAGVAPAGLVGFAQVFAAPYAETHAAAAQKIADAIDTWAKTGTATMTSPPATTVTWT
jgi:hypothetical protein